MIDEDAQASLFGDGEIKWAFAGRTGIALCLQQLIPLGLVDAP